MRKNETMEIRAVVNGFVVRPAEMDRCVTPIESALVFETKAALFSYLDMHFSEAADPAVSE